MITYLWGDHDSIEIDPATGVATATRLGSDHIVAEAEPDQGAEILSDGRFLVVTSLDEGWTVDVTEPPDGDFVAQVAYVPFPD